MFYAIKLSQIQQLYDTNELIKVVDKIGRNVLRYQLLEERQPNRGSFMVMYLRRFNRYSECIGISDSGVMIYRVLIPLFLAKGDSTYLEALKYWCQQKGTMLNNFVVLLHCYLCNVDRFNERIFLKTGREHDDLSSTW